MDRAPDSDSESQGFDSLHAYKLTLDTKIGKSVFGAELVSTFNIK